MNGQIITYEGVIMCINEISKRGHHMCARRRYKAAFGIPVCAVCLTRDRVEIHHINGDFTNNLLSNLCGLCKDCHERQHIRDWIK